MSSLRGAVFLSVLTILIGMVFVQVSMSESQTEKDSITQFDEFHFKNNSYGVRQGKRTDAVIVYSNGEKLFEKYDRGFLPGKKHIMWSISKTLTGLIYGVAYTEGLIRLDQSICDFIKPLQSEQCLIRIQDLLSWTTGIEWLEEYEGAESPEYSSVIAMLYGEGRHDMAHFVLKQNLVPNNLPGQLWRYSSGDTQVAALVLHEIYKGQNFREMVNKKLFHPLGIENWVCEIDGAGVCGGAYYFYLSPGDLIKIGELILNEGRVSGRQLIAADYIQFMKNIPTAFFENRHDHKKNFIPGASLWVNDPGASGLEIPWPALPADAVGAQGHWGQYLLIVPSKKIVAVRVGDTRDHSITFAQFGESVMKLVESVSR